MQLSTIREVAVLRHQENSSTTMWSGELGALAMGSRKVLGKGLLVAQLKLRVEFPQIKPVTLLDRQKKRPAVASRQPSYSEELLALPAPRGPGALGVF